jgi:ketosteroid isomerase-like protein
MDETQQFLDAVLARLEAAERAVHDGDITQRLQMWSRTEPVTLFGAGRSGKGWDQVEPVFRWLGTRFTGCTAYEIDVVAAEARGDLAYLVVLERTTASVQGGPQQSYVLRVTHVFRREEGEWRIVHRHGDPLESPDGGEAVARLLTGAAS